MGQTVCRVLILSWVNRFPYNSHYGSLCSVGICELSITKADPREADVTDDKQNLQDDTAMEVLLSK